MLNAKLNVKLNANLFDITVIYNNWMLFITFKINSRFWKRYNQNILLWVFDYNKMESGSVIFF